MQMELIQTHPSCPSIFGKHKTSSLVNWQNKEMKIHHSIL